MQKSDKIDINGFRLNLTCHSMPEQYDVYKDGVQVAYFSLRWGHFVAEMPDAGDILVYEANPKGHGEFFDDEREYYLTAATNAIENKLKLDKKLKSSIQSAANEIEKLFLDTLPWEIITADEIKEIIEKHCTEVKDEPK